MIFRRSIAVQFLASCVMVALAALFSAPASAEIINIATASYYRTVVASPDMHAVQDFTSTLAGTVSLSAIDLHSSTPNLDLLSAMTTNVAFIGGGQPLVLLGSGTLQFQVERNQNFATSLYGLAAGPTGLGMAALNLSFTPRVGEVPLPAGIWLLASGVALLAANSRRRRTMTGATPV